MRARTVRLGQDEPLNPSQEVRMRWFHRLARRRARLAQRRLHLALASLDPAARDAYRLIAIEGLTLSQAAIRLHLSCQDVEVDLARALVCLDDRLAR